MKVLIVNTSERTGGAAIAAYRLKEALNRNGVKAKMLVRDKQSQEITVSVLKKSWRHRVQFLWRHQYTYYGWCGAGNDDSAGIAFDYAQL